MHIWAYPYVLNCGATNNSFCHRGDQGEISGAEELGGWPLRSQKSYVGRVDMQLRRFESFENHQHVSTKSRIIDEATFAVIQ
jgi:hypothetical protein